MKHAHRTFFWSAALGSASAFAAPAYAAGVIAGTQIQNTASATYDAGSSTTTVQSNTVTLNVDELLDVAVASLDGSPKSAGAAPAVLSFSVTNSGNGNEAFKLTADPNVAGNPFNGSVQTIAYDSNANGTYDPGVDTVVAQGGLTPALSPDTSVKVFVVVSLPTGATDGQISQVRLTAASNTGSGAPGTTFTGQGDNGVDAVVGATTAQANALGSVVARMGTVTLTKTFAIADPFGGSQPVPGSVVTYSIKADVAGSGAIQNLHLTDAIPAGTAYQPASLKLDGSALTDATDADAGRASSSGIDVGLGTVPGGASHTVTFQVKIN